jgi:predicted transcriptional regulator
MPINLSVHQPNYTDTPNVIFDHWLPHLNESELKVFLVILRKTQPFDMPQKIISISDFEKITGLSKSNVSKAVITLQEKGLICKKLHIICGEQCSTYELTISEDNEIKEKEVV